MRGAPHRRLPRKRHPRLLLDPRLDRAPGALRAASLASAALLAAYWLHAAFIASSRTLCARLIGKRITCNTSRVRSAFPAYWFARRFLLVFPHPVGASHRQAHHQQYLSHPQRPSRPIDRAPHSSRLPAPRARVVIGKPSTCDSQSSPHRAFRPRRLLAHCNDPRPSSRPTHPQHRRAQSHHHPPLHYLQQPLPIAAGPFTASPSTRRLIGSCPPCRHA
ncbi:hypothetical protein B0H14DRAFT_2989726 [Mycena olivaceomarginata]|nr:hypothetical protein B0H14DRAFT_2989726 [Mycena olivaceomarginata]